MSIKRLSVHTMPLTPTLALEWATMDKYQGERPYDKKRAEKISAKHAAGLLHDPDWAFAWYQGRRMRMNGQHSSTVLAEMNGEFPKGMSVIVREFSCDTEQDLAELFDQFDPDWSRRTRSDITNAHAKSERSLDGIPPRTIRAATDAIAVWHELIDGGRLSPDDRSRLTHTHQEFIIWYRLFCAHRLLLITSVGAAIYETWSCNSDDAEKFWSLVESEKHENANHPTRALSRWLRETRHEKVGRSGNVRRVYDRESTFERCIHNWNAFREGREVKIVRAYSNKASGITRAR